MKTQAAELAKKLCATIMTRYEPTELPPKGAWHYHQGIFLLGMYKIYEIIKDERYYDYIQAYVDSCMDADGKIWYSCKFDDAMPSILLFEPYKRTKNPKYRTVLDECAEWIPRHFKTDSGCFWHFFWRPHQVWLDGYYMAQPLCVKYASEFGVHEEFYEQAYEQLKLIRQFTEDKETGLWHHAYDESRKIAWADKETGKSPEFWGRAFGWIGVAIVDILDYLPSDNEHRDFFIETLKDYAEAIMKYQDKETGLWYQVLDKGDNPDNWTETSCSCLFSYAILKGMRMGYLDKKYTDGMKSAFCGIKSKLTVDEYSVKINDICIGTGVGDYKHYIERPRTVNDLHGAGAFLHAISEFMQMND